MENAFFIGNSNGHVWNQLQELKEEVTQELLDEGPLCQTATDEIRDERVLAVESIELEWRHRSQLEARLRDINDAQDRLLEGHYGNCMECGEPITAARITADPVVSLCLSCQSSVEMETVFPTL